MKPRGFWNIFFIIATLPLFILLYWLLFSLIMGGEFLYISICLGIGFVLLFGFGVLVASNTKVVTISMTFQDRKAFLSRLNIMLAGLNYHLESQIESFLTYKPSFQVELLGGKISVQIDDNFAIIVGPSTYVKKLQKWLQQ